MREGLSDSVKRKEPNTGTGRRGASPQETRRPQKGMTHRTGKANGIAWKALKRQVSHSKGSPGA
eukprot:9965274-Heterocapsa_arctica.AAC.1